MYFSRIELRDWKTFETARFDFPRPTRQKNIVLIGAPNGYGKTSLFEAIVLCLFGQNGMYLIGRQKFFKEKNDRPTISYAKYLERALHQRALEQSRQSCSVKLVLIDEDDEPIEIQRTWHFNSKGTFQPKDEEVIIYEGDLRKPIGPGADGELDKSTWYRTYISKNILPFELAYFFMFDGEQVSELAEREMSNQVRSGIEGLLGIPILKSMVHDLESYAMTRRRESPGSADESLEEVENELEKLVGDIGKETTKLDSITPSYEELQNERDVLMRELAGYGAGSQALLQEQFEKMKNLERSIEDSQSELEDYLTKDFPFALTGSALTEELKKRLQQETILENWKLGKSQGDDNLEAYIEAMEREIPKMIHTLTTEQITSIIEIARSEWASLWYPPPDNCAEELLHPYLSERDRQRVGERLEQVDKSDGGVINDLLKNISECEESRRTLRDNIDRTESIAPSIDEKRKRFGELNDRLMDQDRQIGAIKNALEALQSMEAQKRKEYSRLLQRRDQAEPSKRRIARAMEVATMVSEIVERAVPSQINEVAKVMTATHSEMAHKKDLVNKIDIDEECNVKLLNASGQDIRRFDISAGEKQVFTQALIYAVSSVSGRQFPLLIDTPLGRLDIDHRKGVLKHFANCEQQVILLSTNTEVVGEHLRAIESHVQKKHLLRFERIGDGGHTVVDKDKYFEEGA